MDQTGDGTGGEAADAYTVTGALAASSPAKIRPTSVGETPSDATTARPRVVGAVFSGPRAGVFDRVTVTFDRATDAGALAPGEVFVTGPNGRVRVSAVQPVAGSGGTKFVVVFSSAQAAGASFHLSLRSNPRSADGTGDVVGDPSGEWLPVRVAEPATN
jgi:hypothetical protein